MPDFFDVFRQHGSAGEYAAGGAVDEYVFPFYAVCVVYAKCAGTRCGLVGVCAAIGGNGIGGGAFFGAGIGAVSEDVGKASVGCVALPRTSFPISQLTDIFTLICHKFKNVGHQCPNYGFAKVSGCLCLHDRAA